MTKIDRPEVADRIHTVDDEKKRVIDFWDMTIPVPEVAIQEAPTRCYEINLEWAKIVMGLVSWLAEIAAWKEAKHENYIAIQEILKFLQGSDCMDCNAVTDCLNQNPDWLGFQNITYTQMVEATQDHLNELESDYIAGGSTPQAIDPDIPVGVPTNSQRNALCAAIGNWLRLYAQAKSAKIRSAGFLSQSWNALQDAIVDLYGTLNNLIGFIVPDDLFSCFVSNEEALTALADTQALEDLQCCIFDALDGVALSQAAVSGAIDGCTSLPDNAGKIACLLSNDDTTQNLLSFFQAYGLALDAENSGANLSCPCVSNYCYRFDMELEEVLWTVTHGTPDYTEGSFTGLGSENLPPQTIDASIFIGTYVNWVNLDWFGVGGGANNLKVYRDGIIIFDGTFGDSASFINIDADVGTLRFVSTRQFAYGVKWIDVNGEGFNPFGVDNCP